MDYEKKYNEALKRAKAAIDIAADKDLVKGVATTIFPELRESDEERMRRCIGMALTDVDEQRFKDFGTTLKDCLAWLEKQKDHHYTKRNALFDKCVENCDPEVMKEVSDKVDEMLGKKQKSSIWNSPVMTNEMIMDEQKEQKPNIEICPHSIKSKSYLETGYPIEQKPAGWSEEDEDLRQDCIRFIETGWTDNGKSHLIPWLKSLPERFNLQPKQEWSEEDETALGDLLWCIEQARHSAKDENDMGNIWYAEKWLKERIKSLRSQPKQEWSEKDKVMFDTISNLLWYGYQESTNENIPTWSEIRTWFLSFYLQHSWKPSEEQMSMLLAVINDPNNSGAESCQIALRGIYEQLKKL